MPTENQGGIRVSYTYIINGSTRSVRLDNTGSIFLGVAGTCVFVGKLNGRTLKAALESILADEFGPATVAAASKSHNAD